MRLSTLTLSLAGIITLALGTQFLRADETKAPKTDNATSAPRKASDKAVDKQQTEIRNRFKKFESALLVMADYLAKTDKVKAQLIRDALKKSQSDRIEVRMAKITKLLESGEFSDAVDAQDQLLTRLKSLLNLLQREEGRAAKIAERKRLEGIAGKIRAALNRQTLERFKNERGAGTAKERAKAQRKLEKDMRNLRKEIDRHDAANGGGQDGKPGAGPKTPGRDDLEQARKAMEKAAKELDQARRAGAGDAQANAERHLRKALDKIEKILKQLREEERALLLRALEARFQLMLRMQKDVYAKTRTLSGTAKSAWTARESERSRQLAQVEDKIALEAAKALALLKAEGSSIAFPQAVKEARSDMLTVTRLLSKDNVGKDTQSIERDIIDVLSELVEALKKEIENGKQGDGPKPKDPPNGKPRNPPLVEKVAELKMLRSLQMRVNRRTRRLGNRIAGDQADGKNIEVVRRLKALAKRQADIQKAAHDLATGRNQ